MESAIEGQHKKGNPGFEARVKQLNAKYKMQREQAEFFYRLTGKLIPLVDKETVTRILQETESEVKNGKL